MRSRSDLVKNARLHVDFLHSVYKAKHLLFDEYCLNYIIYRYEVFWLPLAAKHPGKLLVPPLDIQWVWHVHMLAPRTYLRDCLALVGTPVERHFPYDRNKAWKAAKRTKKYWKRHTRGEHFKLYFQEVNTVIITLHPIKLYTTIFYEMLVSSFVGIVIFIFTRR